MMKKKSWRKLSALLLVALLGVSSLSGCNKKEETNATNESQTEKSEDSIKMITEGYYTYSYAVEGYGQFDFFFHFYDEDPVLGAVFYAGFCNNQVNFAGTYKVEEKEKEYTCAEDRDKLVAEDLTTGKAPYTVTFYDWSGNEMGSCGYDGKILYNDLTEISGTGSENCYYYHDTEGEASKYVKAYEAETGVSYLEFAADEDNASTVSLFHNMTYLDLMDTMIEGNWSMKENSDGGYDYTLTPDLETEKSATLSVSADQMTAEYTLEGKDPVKMSNAAGNEAKVDKVFEGVTTLEEYGTDADNKLNLMDDGTCTLDADVFGNQAAIDTGTFICLSVSDIIEGE